MKWFKASFFTFLFTASITIIMINCNGGGVNQGDERDNILTNDWQQVGDYVSPMGANSEDPTMLIVDQTPAVGYRHDISKTYLNLWDGNSWGISEKDPTENKTNFSVYGTPSFYSDGNNIFMAYSHIGDSEALDKTYYERIFVYKWNKRSKWTILNGGNEVNISDNKTYKSGSAWEPAIACGQNGNTFIAWVETEVISKNNDDVCVAEISTLSNRLRSLNRNKNIGFYATDARTLAIIADSSNNAYIAHFEHSELDQDRCDLYVTKYSRGGFINLGGAIANDYDVGNLSLPSLAICGKDLYIAYTVANHYDYTRHVYVKKYDGNWSMVGEAPVSAFSGNDHDDSANPDLLVVNNKIYIAWEESNKTAGYFIYVAYWDMKNSQWVIIGDTLNIDAANSAHDPSLAYSSYDQSLYIAFEECIDDYSHIFVKRKKIVTTKE